MLTPEQGPDDPRDTLAAGFGAAGDPARFSPNEILLNRFRIVRFVGRGGMGEVYEAEDAETGRIALKTIRPDIAQHPHMLARFRQEVQCARKATGVNVCRIHEVFLLPGAPGRRESAFLTMEFLDGRTLADRIDAGPLLTIEEAEGIAVQICRGLQTIHDAGLIHRDLKAGNVMLAQRSRGTEAVVMDFGLARDTAMAAAAGGSGSVLQGVAVGTPQYMAPEQFQGGPLTPAADVYALGVVLYEMVTGKLPFEGATPLAAAVGRAKPLAHVSSIRKNVPRAWDSTIKRCLSYNPEQRFQSALAVAESLTSRSTRSLRWPASSRVQRGAQRWVWAGSLVLLAVFAILAWIWYSRTHDPGGSTQARIWYRQGVAALRESTYLKATNALEAAVEADKNFALAHAQLADAWNELDFAGKAKDEMLQASSLESDRKLATLDRQYVEAIRHTIMRDFQSALRDYQAIFRSLPAGKKAEGYVDLGRAYEKAGKIDESIAAYKSAAKIDPTDPAPFLHLGILFGRRKQTDEANAAFDKAAQIYHALSNLEGLAEVDYQRGSDANTQHRLDEAKDYLQKSLAIAKTMPSVQLEIRALTRLGVTEYLRNNTQAAVDYENEAIKLTQDNNDLEYWTIDARIRLGNAYISKADYTNAALEVDHALKLAQQSQRPRLIALAQLTMASIRELQGRPSAAIPFATRALNYYQQSGFATETAESLRLLVRAQRDTSDNVAAIESAEQLLSLGTATKSPLTLLWSEEALGEVLLEMERYPEAVEHLFAAVELARSLHYELEYRELQYASVLWKLGEYDKAEQTLRDIPVQVRARPKIALAVDEIRSAMLFSQARYGAALEISRRALADPSSPAPEYFEFLSGEIESKTGSPGKAQELCRKAFDLAKQDADPDEIADANLALADAYLAAGLLDHARPLAEAARNFFVQTGRKESEYVALLTLARIARASKDVANTKKFAQQALDILSGFKHNWTPQQYNKYSCRPDVMQASLLLHRLTA